MDSNVATKQTDTEVIILAIDQRRRHYLYKCIQCEEGCKLIALHVEGHVVRTTNTHIPLPKAIAEEIEDHRQRPQPEEA
jgi:hypothetical protein